MKIRKFFLIKAILFSTLALGIALYAIPIMHESEFFMLKVMFFYMIVLAVGLFWALAVFYRILNRMASDVLVRYDDMERILLDIRDGTKHFYREKRQALRVKTDIIARFAGKVSGDDFIKISDISCDGALIKTAQALRSDEHLKLDIYLPYFPQPISVNANVIRVHATKETKGISAIFEAGLEFTDMPEGDRYKLMETLDLLTRTPYKK